jgi:hypothetical protein
MWQRRTFHECVRELEQRSEQFRAAHAKGDHSEMQTASMDGVELLRILALAVRSEQDHGLTDQQRDRVGALVVNPGDLDSLLANYVPPYHAGDRPRWRPLDLRGAFNKIAHADPSRAEYRASASVHELLLSGDDRGVPWFAVVSVPDMCTAIRSLPDRLVSQTATA